MSYRVKVDFVYNNTTNATTATNNINTYLAGQSVTERAVRSGTHVFLQIDECDEKAAKTIGHALNTRWGVGTRVSGKASVVKRPD